MPSQLQARAQEWSVERTRAHIFKSDGVPSSTHRQAQRGRAIKQADLPQLQRQMAYDRFLARLYIVDDGWIVKGATALLARGIGVRATIDVDIYRAVESHVAMADIARAAKLDLGDWFTFELGSTRTHADESVGVRIPVNAYVGTTLWAQFHIDLVGANLRVVDESDEVTAIARVNMPNVDQPGYRAYPLVDHVTDKVMAIIERHGDRPSTRFKDLVDLVAIITEVSVDARTQNAAVQAEAAHREIILPTHFKVPDRSLWQMGYGKEAQRSLLVNALTLDEALEIVTPFIDPLLNGSAIGRWDPLTQQWNERRRFSWKESRRWVVMLHGEHAGEWRLRAVPHGRTLAATAGDDDASRAAP